MPHKDTAVQDVYTGVAQEVQSIAEQDAKDGMLEAQALLGNIDRKLVKQTVMTSVYGVTWVGAREQVQNRLRDKGWAVTDDLTFKVSTYAATVRAHRPQPRIIPIVCPTLGGGLLAIFVQ